MMSREQRMKSALKYCKDQWTSGEFALRLSKDHPHHLNEIIARINKVDRKLAPKDQLRDRITAAESKLLSNIIVHGPALREALGHDHQLLYKFIVDSNLDWETSSTRGRQWLAKEILDSYPIVFALLVRSRLARYIVDFVRQGCKDCLLPLHCMERNGKAGATMTGDQQKWLAIEGLDRDDWENIYSKQKRHLVPFFTHDRSGDIQHYTFESWCIIPIVKQPPLLRSKTAIGHDTVSLIDGGHSTVAKIKLDPLCTGFGNYRFRHREDWLALKTLKNKSQWEDFLAEVYFWKLWKRKSDERDQPPLEMSPLLCTWEQKDEHGDLRYCLLFPWASGDLRSLWNRDQKNFTEAWLLKQCRRLAETLSFIHHDAEKTKGQHGGSPEVLVGRHGDIKPENILWFAEHEGCDALGTLVLADFGISKAHRMNTKSLSNNWVTKHSPTYRAPEYDLHGHTIGRAADIWALGCTWIEFATWFLSGPDAVNNVFPDHRDKTDPKQPIVSEDAFFVLEGHPASAQVKNGVRNWVVSLQTHAKCTKRLRKFLDMVMNCMLVPEVTARASASDIAESLQTLERT